MQPTSRHSIFENSSPRRCLIDRGNRAFVSTSTNRHITAISLGAAVYKFAGAYFTPGEVEQARYVRSFADASLQAPR
jgi:hypothetical protein